ncbi:MAG: tRNA (adenosine(37)-N6)-dimethylallyltransferase MiaA [Akkermansia sp.]|nr:tRNA (adenosine(37)-N6)-dimethylallyltransferase MiaA [Akkermansia sp.]
MFILGPTGSGKSAVAVELAELLGYAEIISTDAYQVYKRIPIITAAPSTEEMSRVKHHLVGFMEPTENNDAAEHARRAGGISTVLQKGGMLPIHTGGSGLYVKFITHGISPAPPSDAALRGELNALSLEEAVRRLQEADPEGAAATDLRNQRYVVRNLEIVLLGGKPLSYWRNNWQEPAGPGFCIVRNTDELDARIARRAEQMLRDGAIEEVAALEGLTLSTTASKTLGLAQVQEYLKGRLTRSELVSAISLATRQYAKRQRTWLRREQWLTPIMAGAGESPKRIADRIAALLH